MGFFNTLFVIEFPFFWVGFGGFLVGFLIRILCYWVPFFNTFFVIEFPFLINK